MPLHLSSLEALLIGLPKALVLLPKLGLLFSWGLEPRFFLAPKAVTNKRYLSRKSMRNVFSIRVTSDGSTPAFSA